MGGDFLEQEAGMSQGERKLLDVAGASDGPTALYPLGPMEELFRVTAERFGGDGTNAFVVRLGARLQREALEGALAALAHRHPRLRAGIVVDARGKHCFEIRDHLPPIPLQMKVWPDDDLPWEAEGQGPGWPQPGLDLRGPCRASWRSLASSARS